MTCPESGIALVELNRPDELNAWTYSLEESFFNAIDEAVEDPDVRVIVVTGAGRGFCAGASLSMLGESGSDVQRPDRSTRRRITEIAHLPKPVIAAVNGPAAGIGFALALACDLRVVAVDAKLTASFPRLGLVAEHGVAWLLPRLVGRGHATDILLTSRVITGEEAGRIGLATTVTPTSSTRGHAIELAREMVRSGSPKSWFDIKRQLHSADLLSLDHAYEQACDLMEVALQSADHLEGVAAFRERRQPAFAPLRASQGHG